MYPHFVETLNSNSKQRTVSLMPKIITSIKNYSISRKMRKTPSMVRFIPKTILSKICLIHKTTTITSAILQNQHKILIQAIYLMNYVSLRLRILTAWDAGIHLEHLCLKWKIFFYSNL